MLSSASAHSRYIDKAIIDFLPDGSPRQDVKVTNDSDDNLYVKVEVLEVLNPGTDKEERKAVTNSDDISFIGDAVENGYPTERLKNRAYSQS